LSTTAGKTWTFAAAAKELGLTRGRVWQLVKEGKLGTMIIHGRPYVSDYAVQDYKRTRTLRLDRIDMMKRQKEAMIDG
jgi:hypothetical protein